MNKIKYQAYIEPRKIGSPIGSLLCRIFQDYEKAQEWLDAKHEVITKDGEYEIIDMGIALVGE